ncbi:MAG: hydrogenase formation protein HypD [Phycisphaerae bacterium]
MKFIDEYRDAQKAKTMAAAIARISKTPVSIMEICGGQTHAIMKFGIDELLPPTITLIHGPGCPVCVTPIHMIDAAIELSTRPNVTVCSFGDMLRVPGSSTDLMTSKAKGGQVRIIYAPIDSVKFAQRNPDQQVVFFAVGFETTAPANALAVRYAEENGIENFSMLVSHVLVPPAIESILSAPDNRVQAFLAAGHVCTIMGYREYEPLARQYRVPIVVTGFEPIDILQGVYRCLVQIEEGRHEVENQYQRFVQRDGNQHAQELVNSVFEITPREWRGIGSIPASGLKLREPYASFDASVRFGEMEQPSEAASACISGQILTGNRKPHECEAFGKECTPDSPLGAPMVSAEGACSAYYRYRLGRPSNPASQESPASGP